MAYPNAYDPYDAYPHPHGPSLSRRPSLYGPSAIYPDAAPLDYAHSMYGPPSTAVVPVSHRLPAPPNPYDDLDPRDSYFPEQMPPMTPMVRSRSRRHSTVSYVSRPPTIDTYRRPSGIHIKFKRKGSFTAGIGLDEAQSRIRLSGKDAYSMHDLHADARGKILLRVRWAGYSSLTYEIPLDGYDGRVDLQTLARRVSRACVHYLQANVVPIVWNRVQLHHLEEVSYGVWQPMLSSY